MTRLPKDISSFGVLMKMLLESAAGFRSGDCDLCEWDRNVSSLLHQSALYWFAGTQTMMLVECLSGYPVDCFFICHLFVFQKCFNGISIQPFLLK